MSNNQTIIDLTKEHFLDLHKKSGSTSPYPRHVAMVDEIARKLAMGYPQADLEVILLSVWLHDIGTFLGEREVHDVNSEKEARRYLSEQNLESSKIEKVAHAVRAHRCSDVSPETIEAKILAVSDSMSHLYGGPYADFIHKRGRAAAIAKLERDYRDIDLLPNIKDELTPLYEAWKKLLEIIPD